MPTIFRKIGGRLIPIRIGSKIDHAATNSLMPGTGVIRKITAKAKVQIGQMNLDVPKKGVHATVLSTNVEKQFQGHGISRSMFKHAQEILGKIGKKFIRGDEIQHVAQAKIRKKAGKTVFVGTGFGPYGEHNKKVKLGTAIHIIKNPGINGRTVSATTMIPKKFRGKKK